MLSFKQISHKLFAPKGYKWQDGTLPTSKSVYVEGNRHIFVLNHDKKEISYTPFLTGFNDNIPLNLKNYFNKIKLTEDQLNDIINKK